MATRSPRHPSRMTRRFAKARAPEPTRRGAPVATALLLGVVLGIAGTLGVQRALAPRAAPPGAGTEGGPDRGAAEETVRTLPAFEFYDLLPRERVVVPTPERPRDRAPAGADPVPGDQPPWLLQAGSFREAEDADRRRAEILLLGLSAFTRRVRVNDGSVWHRVLVGPFEDPATLRDARTRLGSARIETLVLRPAA